MPSAMKMYEELIVTGAWWDYVDDIASHRVGPILRRHPAPMRRKMRSWSRSLDSGEFFLRKAIGWALRQYAWTDAAEIDRYVRLNGSRLSALSRREALKNIC